MRIVKKIKKIHAVNLSGVVKKKKTCRKIQVGEIVVHLQSAERCWHIFPSSFFSRVILPWAEGELEIC